MKRSISNNKKSPVNVNNNENEIDVNVLLNDPKSLHKMLNKKSDDNDYVPTGANPNKLSNRPKKPYKGRAYYYDEGLWGGKKPEVGQHFKLGNIKRRTEDKQERIAKEQLEKLNAMRTAKKKEEMDDTDVRPPLAFFKEEGAKMLSKRLPKKEKDDIPEFAPYVKKKYSDKREYSKAGELLNKGTRYVQDGVYDTVVKGHDKAKELISDFIKDSKKDGVGETLRNRKNKMEDLIVDFMKNNEFLQKTEKKLKPFGEFMKKIDPDYDQASKLKNKKS
jgi:hypothetical protein